MKIALFLLNNLVQDFFETSLKITFQNLPEFVLNLFNIQ